MRRLLALVRTHGLVLVALPLVLAVAALGIARPATLALAADAINGSVFQALDWFFMVLVTGLLVLSAWLAMGRYGSVRLGGPDEPPEFSTGSWLAMLFSAGMGVGLLFWGVAEPVLHFATAPGVTPGTEAAARHAMTVTLFHWSLHAWAVYCVGALVLAYFGFRRRTSYLPGASLRSALPGRWAAPVAWLADLTAVLAVALGVAGSIAMGVFQLQRGLYVLADFDPQAVRVSLVILGVLAVAYLPPLMVDLSKGMRWISNVTMLLAIVLLAFLVVSGPTSFLLRNVTTSFGDYLSNLVPLSFQVFPWEGEDAGRWFRGWTLTYFVWWIAWAPFVGVFIARISRGRTVREFVLGVLLVPSLFTVLWFAVYGGTGLYQELHGGGGVVAMVRHDVSIALFTLFERLPLANVLSMTAVVLAFVFLVTSVVSAAFVLGMLSEHGTMNPRAHTRIAWGALLALLGAALILSGDIEGVRALAVMGAIPFSLVLVLQVVALLRALRHDSEDVPDPVPEPVPETRAEQQP